MSLPSKSGRQSVDGMRLLLLAILSVGVIAFIVRFAALPSKSPKHAVSSSTQDRLVKVGRHLAKNFDVPRRFWDLPDRDRKWLGDMVGWRDFDMATLKAWATEEFTLRGGISDAGLGIPSAAPPKGSRSEAAWLRVKERNRRLAEFFREGRFTLALEILRKPR